jgi:hypothetical protein
VSDEPVSLDFNDVGLPSRAEAAADGVTRAELVALFKQLEAASALCKNPARGQQGAAIAALGAVATFISGQGYDLAGEISRPLVLLLQELKNAGAAAPGGILPPVTRGQAVEAARRRSVNQLKAAAAYTARSLVESGSGLKRACNEVAAVLIAHRFPAADYFKADGTANPTAENEPGKLFRQYMEARPTYSMPQREAHNTMGWLRDQLESGAYFRPPTT